MKIHLYTDLNLNKSPKLGALGEWVSKVKYRHKVEYQSGTERNELRIQVTAVTLQNVLMRESSSSQSAFCVRAFPESSEF